MRLTATCLEYVQAHPGCSATELRINALPESASSDISKTLGRLVDEGRLWRTGGKKSYQFWHPMLLENFFGEVYRNTTRDFDDDLAEHAERLIRGLVKS